MKMTYELRQATAFVIKQSIETAINRFEESTRSFKRKVLMENKRFVIEMGRLDERKN